MKDIGAELKTMHVVSPQSIAGSANVDGTEIDTKGFKEVLIVVQFGIITATGVATVKVQEHADTGGAYVDIPLATVGAVVGTGITNRTIRIKMTPTRERFLNVNAALVTDAGLVGVVAILGDAANLPADTADVDISI